MSDEDKLRRFIEEQREEWRTQRLLIGRLLGEVLAIGRKLETTKAGDAMIFGLRHGFEEAIDDAIESTGDVPNSLLRSVEAILNQIDGNENAMSEFKGFRDIEPKLKSEGIGQSTIIAILKYLKSQGYYLDVIKKMDSEYSPAHLRKFELMPWE